jgi:hypothetical protein
VHGGLSEKDLNRYSVVINSVSSALCTGTPTAAFEALFTSVDGKVPGATSGASVSSDAFPGQTAVSLYYTQSGKQGAGAITGKFRRLQHPWSLLKIALGNATAATKAASKSPSSSPSVSRDSVTSSGSSGTAKVTGIASTSTSKGGALPTQYLGSKWLAAVAGGAALAVL